MKQIEIRGARTHNLKNIDLDLPRDQLVVVTGLSGSGKSSLAFDTLYAEGQRRYVESLSTYARQFLSMMEKPDVDHIEGLSPAISIEQKSTSHNPRSTVGTVTEIYDYLRLLFARVGTPRCPTHGVSLEAQEVSQMVDQLMTLEEGTKLMVLAPVVTSRKGTHEKLLTQLRIDGYVRIRLNGEIIELDEAPKLKKTQKHDIDVVVDRLKVRNDINVRLAESLETALKLADGVATVYLMDKGENILFSQRLACAQCGYSVAELEPRLFSFNNPVGACPSCDGLGMQSTFDPDKVVVDQELSLGGGAIRSWNRQNHYYFNLLTALADYYGFDTEKPFKKLSKKVQKIILYGSGEEILPFHYPGRAGTVQTREHSFEGILPNMQRRYHETDSGAVRDELAKYLSTHACEACAGTRLREEARHVYIDEVTLPVVAKMSIEKAYDFFGNLEFTGWRQAIALKIQKEIGERLGFLVNVGLNYLTLERSADTLSGGEAQRIRLASQIGAGLVGVMYVLDEPSIGLHQRDNERLLKTLTRLRDLGNTVIVVEHDEDAIRLADYVVDMGPGAGVHGGHVIAKGKPKQIMKSPHSLTGQYLSGKRKIHVPDQRVPVNSDKMLTVTGACGNNLDHVNVEIPLELFTCITGVSGSGKSTLINETLYPLAARKLNGATIINPAPYESVKGLEYLDKVVAIDQSPIGRTPRSNPATYTGIFTAVRDLFSGTAEARSRGYKPGRFSFNVKGGRCEACQGDGVIRVEMHFLPDVYVSCDVCHGKRYNRETLEVRYKGKNIHEALDLTVEDACEFFSVVPSIARKAQTLLDVGLGYIKLGQSATTLSGGEAQRVKLAKELSRRDTGQTLYILDEPTTGLHFYDIEHLLDVLSRLKERGNSIVVIEHNLDVIKTADWIIDLGPEGGDGGGKIIATGTPEDVAKVPGSYTGQFLAGMLN